jgi:predicted transposase YdaD
MGVIELIQTAVLEEVRQESEQVGIQKGRQEGRQEGEQLGIQKGEKLGEQAEKLRLMLNLVQHTDFSDEKIAQLVVADIALVSRVRERVAAGNINLSDLLAE